MGHDESSEQVAPSTSSTKPLESVRLVPYPKIIFMYPTVLLALVVAIWLTMVGEPRATAAADAPTSAAASTELGLEQSTAATLTLIFIWVCAVNTLVLAFDFPRSSSLTLIISLVSIVLSAVLLSRWKPELLGAVSDGISSLQPVANATFYWMIVVIAACFLLAIKIAVRFDYWEIRSNELLHHHGLWGNLKRFSAPHVRIDKEMNDVFEYLLLRSGRLILQPSGESRAIILDNILWIDRKEEAVTKLLGSLTVDIKDD